MNRVVDSGLVTAGATVIPNGVEQAVFHPCETAEVRKRLGLPQDAAILLFASNVIKNNPWRDYTIVEQAVSIVARRPNVGRVLFVGLGDTQEPTKVGPNCEAVFVPYQTDSALVAAYYQAADVYLHASRADTFPNVVLEALACGTPVVATAVVEFRSR